MSAKRHKVKVVVVSGYGMKAGHTYVSCSLVDRGAGSAVWKRYQAKTPLGEGRTPVWKKSLVFGGMPLDLEFALRFDVFDAAKKDKNFIGRVEISKADSLAAIAAYTAAGGKPAESWSKWYPIIIESKALDSKLHVALVPPDVKTADANLAAPAPAEPKPKKAPKQQGSSEPKQQLRSEETGKNAKVEKPWTEERLKKAKKKRVHARQEIIDSEGQYLSFMTALITSYVDPMEGVVSKEDHKKMFAGVKSIFAFHQFFLPLIERTEDIGACFMKYADYLKIYTEYINHYPDVINCLSDLRKDKKFTHFLKGARKNSKMEITGYLIQPVQRIPRYVLLLKELKKYTWKHHPEHDNIIKALAKAQEIATHVNERKRQIENMSKTLEVQSRITGDFDSLIKPDRKMIREDRLTKVSSGMFGSIKHKVRILFLFSDLLMWTTETYQFRGKMSLPAARLEKSQRNKLGVEISSSKELCILLFKSQDEMEKWIHDFEEGKKYAKEIRNRLRQMKRRTFDSKRGKAHTLIMNKFKTLEKKNNSMESLPKEASP